MKILKFPSLQTHPCFHYRALQGWVCSTMKIGTISYICMFLPVLSKIHKESFKLQEFRFDQVLKIPASKFIFQQLLKINTIKHVVGF